MNTHKKLYLITGFLGAGKTTLMKELMHTFCDRKIAIIVNEFGQQGVDGILLSNEGIQVTEINNGSIFCVCRSDLFVDALVQALKTDAEIVLVETSGLSDPTGIGKILNIVNNVVKDDFEYCGSISVVDATNFLKLLHTAVAVSQQIISSQLVLINKTDLADEDCIMKIKQNILQINPTAVIKRTTFSSIEDPEWITSMNMLPEIKQEELISRRTIGTQKLLINLEGIYSKQVIEDWISYFSDVIYRIKGFVKLVEGWHYVDGIEGRISILPSSIIQKQPYLVILASGDRPVKRKVSEGWENCLKEPVRIL